MHAGQKFNGEVKVSVQKNGEFEVTTFERVSLGGRTLHSDKEHYRNCTALEADTFRGYYVRRGWMDVTSAGDAHILQATLNG